MLEQFVAENPTDSFARYGLALEYINGGDTDRGLATFDALLEQNPDYTAAYQMAAQTLLKLGRNDEGRTMLERGIASAMRTGNAHAQREMEGLLDTV